MRRSPRRRDIAIDASRASAARPGSPRSSRARARPPSDAGAELRVVRGERGGRLLEQLDGARLVDRRTPAGLLEADRGAREELGRRRASARARPSRANASSAASAWPARWQASPSWSITPPAPSGSRTPSSRAVANRSSASSKASRHRRLGGKEVVRDRALDTADGRACREVVRERGETARLSPSAPCSSASRDAEVDLGSPRSGQAVGRRHGGRARARTGR